MHHGMPITCTRLRDTQSGRGGKIDARRLELFQQISQAGCSSRAILNFRFSAITAILANSEFRLIIVQCRTFNVLIQRTAKCAAF